MCLGNHILTSVFFWRFLLCPQSIPIRLHFSLAAITRRLFSTFGLSWSIWQEEKLILTRSAKNPFFQHLSYCSQGGQQILSCHKTYSGPLWSFSPSHLSPVLPYHCHHHSHNHHSLVTIIILTFFTSLYWKNGQTSGQLQGFLVQPRHLQISHLGRSGAVWWSGWWWWWWWWWWWHRGGLVLQRNL